MQINSSMTQCHVYACKHSHYVYTNSAASLQIFMTFCMDSTVITTCRAKESLGNTSALTGQAILLHLSFCCFLLQNYNYVTQAYVLLVRLAWTSYETNSDLGCCRCVWSMPEHMKQLFVLQQGSSKMRAALTNIFFPPTSRYLLADKDKLHQHKMCSFNCKSCLCRL